MSRMGKRPLPIPEKVKVEYKNKVLEVSGPLGKMALNIPEKISVKSDPKQVLVEMVHQDKESNVFHGLIRGLVKNAIEGVTKGFKKDLEIQGLGFKAAVEGKNLVLQLGYSHPIHFPIPEGIKITVEKNTQISVNGIDKTLVGEVAATIRSMKTPEPYKGTGIRYVGEHIIKKVGKTAAGAAAAVGGK
ncbi:MAG: 50S ribosomal protein L6 [Endomicrobiales bacterium]|nr:50S ribosomal protein L6 [Endomicrobiales bacterium]